MKENCFKILLVPRKKAQRSRGKLKLCQNCWLSCSVETALLALGSFGMFVDIRWCCNRVCVIVWNCFAIVCRLCCSKLTGGSSESALAVKKKPSMNEVRFSAKNIIANEVWIGEVWEERFFVSRTAILFSVCVLPLHKLQGRSVEGFLTVVCDSRTLKQRVIAIAVVCSRCRCFYLEQKFNIHFVKERNFRPIPCFSSHCMSYIGGYLSRCNMKSQQKMELEALEKKFSRLQRAGCSRS